MTIQRLLMMMTALLVFIVPWVINSNLKRASNSPSQPSTLGADTYRAGMEFAGLVEDRSDAD